MPRHFWAWQIRVCVVDCGVEHVNWFTGSTYNSQLAQMVFRTVMDEYSRMRCDEGQISWTRHLVRATRLSLWLCCWIVADNGIREEATTTDLHLLYPKDPKNKGMEGIHDSGQKSTF